MKKIGLTVLLNSLMCVSAQQIKNEECNFKFVLPKGYTKNHTEYVPKDMTLPSYSITTYTEKEPLDSLAKAKVQFETDASFDTGTNEIITIENKPYQIGNLKAHLLVYETRNKTKPEYSSVYVIVYFRSSKCTLSMSSFARVNDYKSKHEKLIMDVVKTIETY